MNSTTSPAAAVQPAASQKWLWAAVGALGATVIALGATLAAQNRGGDVAAQDAAGPAARLSGAENMEQKPPQALVQQAVTAPESGVNRGALRPAPVAPQAYAQSQPGAAYRPDPALRPAAQGRAVAPACASCGRVESVRAVEQAAPATGLGAVAGGVLGGVLGNQVGKGSGRTAATVLGAVGGGYVGHQVEQRTRTTTVYQMRVRMDDGSVRSFTRAQPVAEGTPVRVDGQRWRVDHGGDGSGSAGAQPVRVVDGGY